MKKPNFKRMSPDEFEAYSPSENESEDYEEEAAFREWCKEYEEDPEDEGSRDGYNEYLSEYGDGFWEGLDDDERDGWEGNITKSFD